MTKRRLVLCVPHAAHVESRIPSMERLRGQIGNWPDPYIEITHKGPHWEWAMKLWEAGRDACDGDPNSTFITIQDDVTIPENFYDVLQAVFTAVPDKIVAGLTPHAVAREIARGGGRWMRTRSWILGNMYSIPGAMMPEFYDYAERNLASLRMTCEDQFTARFCVETGRDTWHPLPSLVEHDTSVPSTWGADDSMHRRAIVSFRNFDTKDMVRPDWWQPSGRVPLISEHLGPMCWGCFNEQAAITYPSGMSLGANCAASFFARVTQHLGANPVHPAAMAGK